MIRAHRRPAVALRARRRGSSAPGCAGRPSMTDADHVLDHHHAAVHNHSKVQRAQRKQVGGMWLRSRQIDANRSAKGMVSATTMAPRAFPRKRKRMIETRRMPAVRFRSTVSTVNLTRSERSRNGTIFTLWAECRVVFVSVQLVHFVVNAVKNRIGVVALLQQHDTFDSVRIVDNPVARAVCQVC